MKKTDHLPEQLSKDAEGKWDQFCSATEAANIALPHDPEMTADLKRVFAFSDFVAKSCIRNPALPHQLISCRDLQEAYLTGEYDRQLRNRLSDVANEEALSRVLREFRQREMIRIAFRDLTARANLAETMSNLSALADASIEQALLRLYSWECETSGIPTGRDDDPQNLVVVGMGKLGARELNFSSDIDLIFAYPQRGETRGGKSIITNDAFFLKLCRRLIKVLGAATSDGIVFRVDMGLRPYGEGGPLVMNSDALEAYYQAQGREWERYAWIKARVVAGDKKAGARILEALRPFIYRRYLDFGVFESLREMKQKIAFEVRRKGMAEDIKLGPGGIREVEFFGQVFQLIRGGVIHALQERGIQKVLTILAREKYIAQNTRDELDAAYVFLRNTEHRLQEFSDQQVQKLPSDATGKSRLAASMGFGDWDAFAATLGRHMETVHRHFNGLLRTEDAEDQDEKPGDELNSLWQNPAESENFQETLASIGFDNPDAVVLLLRDLQDDLASVMISQEGQDRISKLIPLLLREAGLSDQSAVALNRVIELIKAIKRRTSYVSLLLENPAALTHLVRLASTSSWILGFLTRHPVLMDELLDPRTLYFPPGRSELEKELLHRLGQIPPGDLEYQMEELRLFRQVNTLRVAAADITNTIPLMTVSDYLSDIAETVLNKVLEISWEHLAEKHGNPICSLGRETFDRGFAVIAYGKLGGLELGYASDLDLVFLHAGTGEDTKGGARSLDTTQFFARLGQRVVHILATHTASGILYDADMRLRPSGTAGLLVSHIDGFRNYQLTEAWTWEKQALIRARPVAGDVRMIRRFEAVRKEVLGQPRDKAALREEVLRMRERMREELLTHDPGMFDLKQDAGGIVDIEFLVQYLVLLHAHEHPELLEWTDNVRLIGVLAETRVTDDAAAYFLRKAYLTYRTAGHRLSLREKPAKVPDHQFSFLRKCVRDIWAQYLGKTGKNE
ncbi:MAG: bifunctional glutamine synthetase adenylyltransferase/deadenyltransferase [Desulfobacteraceae bacterium 4572_88]|nr:MAG: bifunctional glutamine synthetase adenylyltransferase/deadenyltransferase [Desulfobacteraceae bacterium 4572_88]